MTISKLCDDNTVRDHVITVLQIYREKQGGISHSSIQNVSGYIDQASTKKLKVFDEDPEQITQSNGLLESFADCADFDAGPAFQPGQEL